MKSMKLSTFIMSLQKLQEKQGDLDIFPVYHDGVLNSLHAIKRARIITQEQCKTEFDGYGENPQDLAKRKAVVLVFEE